MPSCAFFNIFKVFPLTWDWMQVLPSSTMLVCCYDDTTLNVFYYCDLSLCHSL